ncbi:MAG: hypothetical protein ACLVJX_07430 [Merdibacter sp.]
MLAPANTCSISERPDRGAQDNRICVSGARSTLIVSGMQVSISVRMT